MLTSSFCRAVISLAAGAALLAGAVLADGPNGEQCGAVSGGQRCGMNLCCSGAGWCGFKSEYCGDTCQSAYGSCTLPTVQTCPTSQKTATNGRRVAYWQVRQASERSCNKVLPSQIKTAGVSHLVLSFALIEANTFNIVPSTAADVAYYTQFTALQSSSLRTWVAIGGGGFSPATWTAMAATSASRAKFISSLSAFLRQYKFQGVDLDWEFPNPTGSDAQNLIALVRELRAALGSSYGISAALPADLGSVRGFNAAGMLQYLDFFNFMAYDIHGWGIDSVTDRTKVSYPANVLEIADGLMPLWMSNLTPSKVNLGIPLYGRGYTLANTSCSWAPCAATGPSVSGSCVRDSSGIMALSDLKTAITANNAWIVLDKVTMQKYAVWGNQWVAYDDASTLALKLNWADSLCLGGAMFWSNDLGGGSIASEIIGTPS